MCHLIFEWAHTIKDKQPNVWAQGHLLSTHTHAHLHYDPYSRTSLPLQHTHANTHLCKCVCLHTDTYTSTVQYMSKENVSMKSPGGKKSEKDDEKLEQDVWRYVIIGDLERLFHSEWWYTRFQLMKKLTNNQVFLFKRSLLKKTIFEPD